MAVLLLADATNGSLNYDPTSKAVTAVQDLGEVTVLCVGSKADAMAQDAAKISGVSRVISAKNSVYDHQLAESVSDLIVSLSEGYEHIVAPATSDAKNILPRVSALLDVQVISDIISVIDTETFMRPIYAGNAIQTIKSRDVKKVITIRVASFEATAATGTATVVSIDNAYGSPLSSWIEDHTADSDRPELTSAKTVVSGGRGVGSEDDFKLIERLADQLDAAVGASRAAVDSGYAANDLQVGQTGKVVAPDLYVAVGISGAIQHLAGMKDSKVIVAINKDPDAPIFQVADYGLVADLFDALPELSSKL